jgi:hypothetical protein
MKHTDTKFVEYFIVAKRSLAGLKKSNATWKHIAKKCKAKHFCSESHFGFDIKTTKINSVFTCSTFQATSFSFIKMSHTSIKPATSNTALLKKAKYMEKFKSL